MKLFSETDNNSVVGSAFDVTFKPYTVVFHQFGVPFMLC